MTSETQGMYDLSLEELRQLAEKELSGEPTDKAEKSETEQERVRDEKGRFVAQNENEEIPAVEQKKTFKRVIDLGDGSGAQVFEADNVEALLEKLAKAQEHATRKIREQEAELKTFRASKQKEEKQQDADNEFVVSQELLARPSEAFKKLFKQTTGVDIEQFKSTHERSQAIIAAQDKSAQVQERGKTGDQFIAANPDYVDNTHNGQIMTKWMQLHGNDFSLENFNKAYQDLKESGLLNLQTEEAHADTKQKSETTERIAQPKTEVAQQRTKKASGLSTQSRSAVPQTKTPSEDDAYKMSLEDLRSLANNQLAGK